MVLWAVLAVVAVLAVGGGLAWARRSRAAAPRRSSPGPARRSAAPAAPAPLAKLPPARIVLVTSEVPVVDLVRVGASADTATGEPLDAPALVARLAPVIREAGRLMALPGSRRCRAVVRVEVARAIRAGILPLLVARRPVAMPTGEGIEALPADPAGLSDLGVVAWQTAGGAAIRRFLVSLEGRIAALDGPALPGAAIRDTVAALRARRGDLVRLADELLLGPPSGAAATPARALLQEVEVSSAARTEPLLREIATSTARGEQAALALRRAGGSLLVTVALRAAAVEVHALLEENADQALTRLVELQTLLERATQVVVARRTGDRTGIDAAVAEVLALAKEVEGALRAIRERLFAHEISILFEPAPDDGAVRLWLA